MAFSGGLPVAASAEHFKAFFSITEPIPKIDVIQINRKPRKKNEAEDHVIPMSRFSKYDKTPLTAQDLVSSDEEEIKTLASCIATKSHWDQSLISGDMKGIEVDTLVTGMDELAIKPVDINHITRDSVEVYNHYNFTHTYDSTLPIYQHKDEILDAINSQPVTVIEGMTGSGKTTQVPQYILDEAKENEQYCNIVVTQPRKIAATSIARRVCDERQWSMGRLVGYQVGLDKVTCEDTRITYMTVGVLLRKLVKAKSLNQYTHIILDEVHERDQETDFAMLIVRKFLFTNSPFVKVILMSATINIRDFCSYFGSLVRGKMEEAKAISIKGRSYNVSEHYLNDIMSLGTFSSLDPLYPDISEQVFEIAVKLIKHFDDLEKEDDTLSTSSFPYFDEEDVDTLSLCSESSSKRGSVLVFLPGIFYIREMEQILQNSAEVSNLHIVPLHSSITLEEQSHVFSKPKPGDRKVILATNIAESSITVPDIKYVIDFCLTKALVCDLGTNYQSLRLQWASKANCNQRKGRAGRVSNGRVYRLINKEFWNESIPAEGIPEMQRCPLENLILQVKLLDIGNPKAILFLAMSPPCLEDIERTILLLKEIGAISTLGPTCNQKHDGHLTFVGRVLAEMPLDMRLSKLLLLGFVFGCLSDCTVIAASLSRGGFFATPYRKWMDAYKQKLKWAEGSFSDPIAALNAYRMWEECVRVKKFRRRKDEYDWCKRHYIQPRRMHEVSALVKEITDRLANFNIQSEDEKMWQECIEDDRELILKVVMAGAFYPNYFRSTYPDDDREIVKLMCELDSRQTVRISGFSSHQAPLYSDSIVELFKECGEIESLHYDGTKAYIKFDKQATTDCDTGEICPAVYSALRMRQPRRKIIVDQSRKSTPFTDRLLNQLFLYEPVNKTAFKKVVPRPGSEDNFLVRITHIKSVNHFWGFKLNERCIEKQREIYTKVQDAATNGRRYAQAQLVSPGDLVLAPYDDGQTSAYYRAVVIRLVGLKVVVKYVDYGNMDSDINLRKLVHIPESLKEIPFQAIEFELVGINLLHTYPPESSKVLLERIVHEAENKIKVEIYSVLAERVRVTAYAGGLNVNEFLVENGIAENMEENKLSEKSHWQWELASRDKITDEDEFAHRQRRAEWKIVPENARGSVIPPSGRMKQTQIYGPDNGLQMQFTSIINIGRMRNVCVVQDSVNTVALNQNPQDVFMQMMIAASVGINETGSTMLARNTTLMPRIHGLNQVLVMLFTPVMELRANKDYTQLIGALCGLGAWKNKHGKTFSILPEHDVELLFNTNITAEDISDINGLRMVINLTIGTNEMIASWSRGAINKTQRKARSLLLKLIRKNREPKEPQCFHRTYKWNQLNELYVMSHEIAEKNADNKNFYRLHDGVMIRQ